jgi:hypothetical protein
MPAACCTYEAHKDLPVPLYQTNLKWVSRKCPLSESWSARLKEEVEELECVDLAKSIFTDQSPLFASFYALGGEFHMTRS